MLSRRQMLAMLAAAGGAAAMGLPGAARASAEGPPHLVVVMLRGGLDGLHALVPHGDPAYRSARGALALPAESILDLDGTFGLHPALSPIHSWFGEGQLLPMHAMGLPYRERSHFDAQDVLDNGTARPNGARDGWLNRALGSLSGASGVAVGRTVPLVLRGAAPVLAIDPSRNRAAHPSLMDDLDALYASDGALAGAMAGARRSMSLLPDVAQRGSRKGLGPRAVGTLAKACTAPGGPTAVVVDVGGWDTHANQGVARGSLANRLSALAEGLVAIRGALGPAWGRTVVLVVTEFGRTVAVNGTQGTDHGVGSAGFLLGGALAGGEVLTDWPGLHKRALLEGRDLRPTTDLRAVFAGLLRDHLGVDRRGLQAAFPGFDARGAMDGLIREG